MKPGARQSELARMSRRLRSIADQADALELAIDALGVDGLRSAEWRRAYTSGEPQDINAVVLPVMGGYEHLVTNVVELAKAAARVTGLVRQRRPTAEQALDALSEAGGLSRAARRRLGELYVFCGRLGHASPDIEADEIAVFVERALRETPPIVVALRRWLERDHRIGFD